MKIDGSYDQMFGSSELPQFHPMILPMMPVFLDQGKIESVMRKAEETDSLVLAFFIGTKPCYYKFYGSVMEWSRAGLPGFVVDTKQHYQANLIYGKQEFAFKDKIACELGIRGDLATKAAELMVKVRWLAHYLKGHWPDVTVIPVVLGDTILTGIVPAAWMFSRGEKAIHNEAGLRGMAPVAMKQIHRLSLDDFVDRQFRGEWELLRNEPMPEQWDTFVSGAGAQLHLAPLEINQQHLIREGYQPEHIRVIGGVVADAVALKRREHSADSVFERYPKLAKGKWIRVDIHRRGNMTPTRFRAIVGAIVRLVEKGYRLNFVEMNATHHALKTYNLERELRSLEDRENFLYTEVWPKYGHVIEFLESDHCLTVLTDSGGVQEEMNLLRKPCLTCRFNTDRPETVNVAGSNLLLPPLSAEFLSGMLEYIVGNKGLWEKISSGKILYDGEPGKRFVEEIRGFIERGESPFQWAHDALGYRLDEKSSMDHPGY